MKTRKALSLLLALLLALSLQLSVPAAEPEAGAPAPFRYQHDPRLNETAMRDIVVDPTAVYGFSPSPEGSLSVYVDFDWTDPEMVNGEHARLERIAYHESLGEMYTLLDEMTEAGKSTEEIARTLSAKRNELRLAAYDGNPEGLATAKERNLKQYGHEEGPLPEELFEKYGSWEIVLEKAFSVNSGMDACLGLYDDYYALYVATGQVAPENVACATREYAVAAFAEATGLPAADAAVLDAFSDGGEVSPCFRVLLADAVSAGVLKGYDDGALRPKEAISRIEAFVLLSRCLPELALTGDALEFTDVPAWAKEDVDRLSASGLVLGYGGGVLGAGDILTVEQVGILVSRLRETNARIPAELSLWTPGAEAKSALISYVRAVTDETGPDYIPVEDRIAVFDLDGTLFCETDPNYFDYTLLAYRVLTDPDYRDRASDFEREVAEKISEQNRTGASFPGLEVDHGKAVASAFAGMTLEEFNRYIQEFKRQPMPSYEGMTRGEGWYLPMLQVVDYLKENDFTVYVVSGTDRLIVRGIAYRSPLGLPNRQLIGSDETIVSSGQGSADGLDYVFAEGDELILGGEFLIKNLKMNKVSVIQQEIGQQPVLSFGNSTGDSSMAEYVTSNNPYRSLAFMLCCDDTERENGNQAKAEKMFALCEEFDWVPVSMKNDWTTIYGPGVTKR
ncbi:MAG: S-layer homology domain-containing protein [Oscillospiraceae bacterium]|nr:S-layer homology domain-containing protein [Oscillospiraceae bacterium]